MLNFLKTLLKTLIRLLFPRRYQVIYNWLNDLTALLRVKPGEVDLVYWAIRKNPGHRVMIDVGAHFGTSLRRFALETWRIFAFEPDPVNRARLEELCRPWDNVSIDTRAVANEEQTDVPIYHSEVSSGISGMSSFHPSHEEIARVSTVTLDHFCAEKTIEHIDFLKIDTEGHDLFVLQSIPWDRIKPRVIVTEFEDRKTVPLGYNVHDLARYLSDKGYRVLVSEWYPVVEYGADHQWRTFGAYPTELMGGGEACGNLIAALDLRDLRALLKVANRYQLLAKFTGRSARGRIKL